MNGRNKRRVFVTGASGFVGASIIRKLLEKKYEVHILSRTKKLSWRFAHLSDFINVHKGDLKDSASLRKILTKASPDYIIHLAVYGAYHYQTELEKIIQVNIEGTKNLLEASRDVPYKCFINTGSSSEYGYKDTPMKESDACDPVSYYAVAKLASTHLCKVFAEINNKPIVTLRLFSVFGHYEEPTRFIPTIMKSLIQKQRIKLTAGKQRHDFIYVDDVSDAYIKALSKGKKIQGEIFNIGTGREYTNDEIVQRLFTITHDKTKIEKGAYPKRAWDTPHWRADLAHTKKVLGWKPKHTLDQGLLETYSWMQRNLQLYK